MPDGHKKNREAFNLGYADYERGHGQHHNPFHGASTRHEAYMDGWTAACQGLVCDPVPWGWLAAPEATTSEAPDA